MTPKENQSPLTGEGPILRQSAPCRWQDVEVMPYKEGDSTQFSRISRQLLSKGEVGLPIELRTFEIKEGGHSTLERHKHIHLVMVLSGSGHALVHDKVHAIGFHDVVHVPAWTWHQFQADNGEDLHFLCIVHSDRDRPTLPMEGDLVGLRVHPEVAEFIRI